MKKEKFYAGGFLYNPKTKSILLHKRDSKTKVNPEKWAFFGGLNEQNETPMQTFQREIREEISVEILENEISLLCNYFNDDFKTYRYVFFAKSDLDKSKMCLTEGDDFNWIPLNKVFQYDLTEKTINDLKLFIKNNETT